MRQELIAMNEEQKTAQSAPEQDIEAQSPEQEDKPAGPEEGKGGAWEIYSFFQSLVLVLSALVLIFTFLGRLITVDGTSMVPTLLHGELMLVRSVGYTPEQGDIVVLTQVSFREEAIVKRVIAKGGQTVEIDYMAGTVSVDGVVLDEPYLNEEMLPRGQVTSMVVPEGCIFVMGDNRNVSADSRYSDVGVIDERRVIGQAVAVIFPFGHFTLL